MATSAGLAAPRLLAARAAASASHRAADVDAAACYRCGIGPARGGRPAATWKGPTDCDRLDHAFAYAFFHDQDAETAIDGSLYLSYGALDGSAQAAIAIGNEIVAALKAAGLQAEWSGDLSERIELVKLDWKKRRFTKAPAIP